MQAGPILVDDTSRGLIHSLFYPVAFVQVFRPCSWYEFNTYLHEGSTFRCEIMRERHLWLVENRIKCHMFYDTCDENLQDVAPRLFRLYTEFHSRASGERYVERWADV